MLSLYKFSGDAANPVIKIYEDYTMNVKQSAPHYKYKQNNPLNPAEVWTIGKYFVKQGKASIILDTQGYDELVTFLEGVDSASYDDLTGLWIQYTHGTGAKVLHVTNLVSVPQEIDDIHYDACVWAEIEFDCVYNDGVPPTLPLESFWGAGSWGAGSWGFTANE